MLRDPKDVVVEVDQMTGSRAPSERAYIIRADRAAVIAEAKRVLGEVLAMPSAWPYYRSEVLDALDDILKETP